MAASRSRDGDLAAGFLASVQAIRASPLRVGDCELHPSGLIRFNAALRRLDPRIGGLSLDQVGYAARRVLQRHADGATPLFVQSRLQALERLCAMAADPGWSDGDGGTRPDELRRQLPVLLEYRDETRDLIPDPQPAIGLLDDALLVDASLQLLSDELASYEDFRRFRRTAAEFAGCGEIDTGLHRGHWLEWRLQASGGWRATTTGQIAPDLRASLFLAV